MRNAQKEKRYWSRGRELNSRPADYESAALPLSYLGLEQKTTLASAENCCQFISELGVLSADRKMTAKCLRILTRERVHGPADPDTEQQKEQQRPCNVFYAIHGAAPAQEAERDGYQEREQQHGLQVAQ